MSVKNYKTPTGWRPQTLEHKKDKDPVDVICRIKPLDQDSGEQCITVLNSRAVKLMPPPTSYTFRNSGKEQYYKFQHVFSPEASQKHLFDQVAKPLVADLLQGKNSLLFAYGVTGSGKTYTMQGTPEDCGVLQRTLDVIFNSIQDYQAERCVFVPDCMNGFDVQTEDEAAESRKALNTQMNVNKTPRTQRQRIVSTPAQDIPHRIPDGSRVHTLIEDNKYAVFVTYIEIYQNYIYDLLEQLPTTSSSSR
ncbi:kinesin-like protein KIF23 [Homarus americanus]|uniref:kinesin-like protein KIF23 n=1 Tax=Homarus americanus TaxID=6706 RepID=UPI001C44D40B|nr:kinesin-like protein KIF23 [Homarus americanus]